MLMPKTTQGDEFSRVLENPDNFIVSEGFEDIFESFEDPEPVPYQSLFVAYSNKKIPGELIKLKMSREAVRVTLKHAGYQVASWLQDQSCIGTICSVSGDRDLELHGELCEIQVESISSDVVTVKYTISLVKNT